jgi:hypothetical protein
VGKAVIRALIHRTALDSPQKYIQISGFTSRHCCRVVHPRLMENEAVGHKEINKEEVKKI